MLYQETSMQMDAHILIHVYIQLQTAVSPLKNFEWSHLRMYYKKLKCLDEIDRFPLCRTHHIFSFHSCNCYLLQDHKTFYDIQYIVWNDPHLRGICYLQG